MPVILVGFRALKKLQAAASNMLAGMPCYSTRTHRKNREGNQSEDAGQKDSAYHVDAFLARCGFGSCVQASVDARQTGQRTQNVQDANPLQYWEQRLARLYPDLFDLYSLHAGIPLVLICECTRARSVSNV